MAYDFKKLDEIVKLIAEKYFVDLSSEKVGTKKVENWKVLMGAFSGISNRNTLLMGNPGSGKTTYSGVISSLLTGLPFDLYDFEKIQGHPDQTKDTMLARADLGRLHEEGVVWQAAAHLPALTLDELNRLPPGKQSIFLEYIRTGAIEHLGKYFSRGKVPVFATMNYNGTGTYPVPAPSLDRFDISLEFPVGAAFVQNDIRAASRQIKNDLTNPEMTEEVIKKIMEKDVSLKDKLDFLKAKSKENLKKKGMPSIEPINEEELDAKPYTADADCYMRCIFDEINTPYRYGENRSVDPRDSSEHNKTFASSKVLHSVSPRFWDSVRFYASILAHFMNSDKVEVEHVKAVAPYCLAHRTDFSPDYEAKFAESPRLQGERKEMDLSRRILKEVKDNYDKIADDVKLLDNYLQNSGNVDAPTKRRVETFLKGPVPDHPTLRSYYKLAKDM